MKRLMLLTGFALALAYSPSIIVQFQSVGSQTSQHKVKVKEGRSVVRDKSKPVRKAIEDWYESNVKAFESKSVSAIMALRTSDFHTITPDGTVNTRADMETRTQRFLDRIDYFISQDNQIGTIEIDGNLVSADVTQRTVRIQRFPDGTLHKVEAAVVQRETWKMTEEGWKLFRVDNIRDAGLLVDGQPYRPNP